MALRWLLGFPAVVVCMLATASMAFRFGWSLGSENVDRWLYGGAGIAVDVLKALLPLLIVWAWSASPRKWAYCIIASGFFVLFTGYSLLCSFGLAAIQSANKASVHTAAAAIYKDRRAHLDRLIAQRAQVQPFTPTADAAVTAADNAVVAAATARAQECGKVGPNCRARVADETARRAELAKTLIDKATTDRAAHLDGQIAQARATLSRTDIREATREADPQAAAIAVLLGSWIGGDREKIRTIIHAVLALVLEAGSGFGLYLVFATHGAASANRPPSKEREARLLQQQSKQQCHVVLNGDVFLPSIETPADIIERFFRTCMRPALGERASAAEVNAAYEKWCFDEGLEPVSPNRFGRLAPWRKDRIGGRVWYLDASLHSSQAHTRARMAAATHAA